MRYTLITILLLVNYTTKAQFYQEALYANKVNKGNPAYQHVKTITYHVYNKKNKLQYIEVSNYFDNLKWQHTIRYNNKNQPIKENGITYFNDSLQTSYYIIKKGDTIYINRKFYNNKLQVVKHEYQRKKKLSYNLCKYNDQNKMVESLIFNKKNKPTAKYEYSFYENGSRKETRYFKMDKLKYVWSYECSETGELETKNQTKICKKLNKNADGTFTEVFETTSKRNKISRLINTYTADTILIAEESINAKGKMFYKYEYDRMADNNKLLQTKYYRRGKLKTITKNTLNNRSIITKSEVFNHKNKLVSFTDYTYQFYEKD